MLISFLQVSFYTARKLQARLGAFVFPNNEQMYLIFMY